MDEDKLVKTLRKDLEEGKDGCVIDFHTCDIFPPSWFDLVLVLRVSTEVLYDRLQVVAKSFLLYYMIDAIGLLRKFELLHIVTLYSVIAPKS